MITKSLINFNFFVDFVQFFYMLLVRLLFEGYFAAHHFHSVAKVLCMICF